MIFLFHIPKTAGSELFTQLKTGRNFYNFGPDDPPTGIGIQSTLRHLAETGCDVTRAHCDASVLQWMPEGTRVITLLRDPVDRIYSLFRRARQFPDLAHYANGTLDDFLRADLRYRNCDNAMVRRLAGIFYLGIEPDESHLEQALDTLKSFWHVGFKDNFGATVKFINQETGWNIVNRGAPARDHEYHEELIERNLLDIELYTRALCLTI